MCEYFGATDIFSVDCNVVGGHGVLFLLFGPESAGRVGKISCCIVLGIFKQFLCLRKMMSFEYLVVLNS